MATKKMSDVTFDTIPVEVQCSIFRLLNPIDLISVSQTCKDFRVIINPQRRQFVERLLALECREEDGGNTAVFRSNDNTLCPGWKDEDWKANQWACTGCLRLLAHHNFDNHSLLRLGYRKPTPDSPAALAPSSWEPSGQHISGVLVKRRKELEQAAIKRLKRQYSIATTYSWSRFSDDPNTPEKLHIFQEAGMKDFLNMSLAEFQDLHSGQVIALLSNAAEVIECRRCGFKRHLRQCNECRFQKGNLRSHSATYRSREYGTGENLGTKTVPIVVGRRLAFGTSLDRYFPTFCEKLVPDKPRCGNAPVFTIYREFASTVFFTLYMIRCPGCARWLEMRAFRCGGMWPKWWPGYRARGGTNFVNWDGSVVNEEFINGMLCNSCYASKHGEAKLLETLTKWFMRLADVYNCGLEYMFYYGWWAIWYSIDQGSTRGLRGIPRKYHFEIRTEVLAGVPWVDYDDKRKGVQYDKADLQALNKKHKAWMEIYSRYRKDPTAEFLLRDGADWFDTWMRGYDRLEAQWVWLKKCREEIEKRPESLLDWARCNETRYTR